MVFLQIVLEKCQMARARAWRAVEQAEDSALAPYGENIAAIFSERNARAIELLAQHDANAYAALAAYKKTVAPVERQYWRVIAFTNKVMTLARWAAQRSMIDDR